MADWQTIDSVPKAGKFLIALFAPTSWNYWVGTVALHDTDTPRTREIKLKYATHWQPLPPPPTEDR